MGLSLLGCPTEMTTRGGNATSGGGLGQGESRITSVLNRGGSDPPFLGQLPVLLGGRSVGIGMAPMIWPQLILARHTGDISAAAGGSGTGGWGGRLMCEGGLG